MLNINFKQIQIHHFLSFGDATIKLNDRGYCLVSGINNNPKDAAKSNGSGKSTIWSAISYALVGKTIQGTTSNLVNNYYNDGCWVKLSFDIDNTSYELIRSKDDKEKGTNLKILVNGADKSGKGIQESQKILEELLPDLTEELIGSVIILGQGMPDKFTKNTPSKRKERLEHLSKSDFMIDDLKNRVNTRLSNLNNQVREMEDSSLTKTTQQEVFEQQLNKLNNDLTNLVNSTKDINFNDKISNLNKQLSDCENNISNVQKSIEELNAKIEEESPNLVGLVNKKNTALDKVKDSHNKNTLEYNSQKSTLSNDIRNLETKIKELKNISDICPTCGQKIPNVIKPDTTQYESQLTNLTQELSKLNEEIILDNEDYQETIKEINETFDKSIQELQSTLLVLKEELRKLNQTQYNNNNTKILLNNELQQVITKRDTFEDNKTRIEESIKEHVSKLTSLKVELEEVGKKITNLKLHLEVVNKMNTYIKRDFRGFLLQNIISYIEKKAKEYSAKIFDTDEIVFALDGNNIEIAFCNKSYENLSGGEKQRVDLIIQFAIRDMMTQYLDFNSNILVLDEITDALDSISCDRVLNFINKELSGVESVFIISHHANELDIANDGEIIVSKDANGVSEVITQY